MMTTLALISAAHASGKYLDKTHPAAFSFFAVLAGILTDVYLVNLLDGLVRGLG